MTTRSATRERKATLDARIRASVLAAIIGSLFVFIAGFAGPHSLHDAAHDSRHTVAFPCH